MRIEIKKGQQGPDLLKCIRKDGSVCEAELSTGSAYHDLAHFVVKSNTGNQEGFWGRIAEGYSIEEYALPNEQRAFQISETGYHAEFLATLLQTAIALGNPTASGFDSAYTDMLRKSATAQNIPFPTIPNSDVLSEWIEKGQALTKKWKELAAGEMLVLKFP